MHNWAIVVLFSVEQQYFSLSQIFQTGSGVYSAPYSVCTGDLSPRAKLRVICLQFLALPSTTFAAQTRNITFAVVQYTAISFFKLLPISAKGLRTY